MAGRNFPDWLDAYMQYTDHAEAPDQYHYWVGVAMIAGALQRKVWIPQAHFIYTPNFYIVLVGPPAVGHKSTTINMGRHLLKRLDGVKFGPNTITWQRLVEKLAGANQSQPFGDDPLTAEYFEHCSMTICSKELGSFFNPTDSQMIDVMTDLWDADDEWTKETKTSGKDTITHPWLNFISGTTPGWLFSHVPRYVMETGFFSRIIFVYAEKKRRSVAYPDLEIPENWDDFGERLSSDLEKISALHGVYKMTPEAYAWGKEWYDASEKALAARDPLLMQLGTYVGRRQAHLHKIAMTMAAAQRDELIITAEDLEHAWTLLRMAEKDMARMHNMASDDKGIANGNHLAEMVRSYPSRRVRQDMLFKLLYNKMTYDDFNTALKDCIMSFRVKVVKGDDNIVYVEYITDE